MNHRAQRDQQLQRQQELVNTARAESRELTAEEQAEFDRCQREIDRLNPLVEAEERQAAAGAAQTTPAAGAESGTPAADDTQRAIEAERTRISDITSMCRDFGIDPQQYINNGSSMDASAPPSLISFVRTTPRFLPASA